LHANSPAEALSRLETLCLMADIGLPSRAVRMQIAGAVHIIVQQTRYADGSRRIIEIAEVTGIDDHGELTLHPLFVFQRATSRVGEDHHAKVEGSFRATGYVPTFIGEFYTLGLVPKGAAL
jgi:pilus assembly protein CpaF